MYDTDTLHENISPAIWNLALTNHRTKHNSEQSKTDLSND